MTIITPQLTTDPMANIRNLWASLDEFNKTYDPNHHEVKIEFQQTGKLTATGYKVKTKTAGIKSSQIELDLRKAIAAHPDIIISDSEPNFFWGLDGTGTRRITIDIHGTFKGNLFALEYDGGFWHRLPSNFERDLRKSKMLLRHGYKVLRVREAPLKFLPIDAPNFYQFHFLYDPNYIQQNFAILLPQIFTMLEL